MTLLRLQVLQLLSHILHFAVVGYNISLLPVIHSLSLLYAGFQMNEVLLKVQHRSPSAIPLIHELLPNHLDS